MRDASSDFTRSGSPPYGRWDQVSISASPLDHGAMKLTNSARTAVPNQAQAVFEAAGLVVDAPVGAWRRSREIIHYARSNAIDLIACGSRGLSPVASWLLGSVSRKLVHYANCSVLIVK
jgi:nucleotide-binding universal stress UspA family protein